MKKTNKRAKIITVIAIVTVIVFAGILIATNVIKNNNVNNESYLATANANSDLVASYIKSGVTIGGIMGTLETIDVSNATATAEDVLEGKTFYAGSNEIKTGIMKSTELHRIEVYNNSNLNDWQININIKNILPDVYNKLTVNNFGITNSVMEYRYNAYTNRGPTINSYNPDTGILYCYSKGDSGLIKSLVVVAWYVE